jgi:hypothetical protein
VDTPSSAWPLVHRAFSQARIYRCYIALQIDVSEARRLGKSAESR